MRSHHSARRCTGFAAAGVLVVLSALAPTTARADFFTVSSTDDSGAGTLRAAIAAANANGSLNTDQIDFDIPGSGPFTITLATSLPPISTPTVIWGFDEAISGAPGIQLIGSGLGGTADGLVFAGSADGSGVSHLSITGFSGDGIDISSDLTGVSSCYLGVAPDGATALPNGNGVRVTGATGGTIGGTVAGAGNLISGNTNLGIVLGNGSSGVTVAGNKIGTNAAGTAAIANSYGIDVHGSGHTIGGSTVAARNLISGNTNAGVVLDGTNQSVKGNHVGTNADGSAALANGSVGIQASSGSGHQIGGTGAGEGNLVSGNTTSGIELGGTGVVVRGNRVGTNAAGAAAIANGSGIRVYGTGHTIGGGTAAERNLISGNTASGIVLNGTNQIVRGNYVGTNVDGTAALANAYYGIQASSGSGHQIGGTGAGEGNLVSGNTNAGIQIDGTGVVVRGNKVGTNALGTAAIANGSGIGVFGTGHTIGGGAAAARNLISGNPFGGIYLAGSGHVVSGNYIGTNAAGTATIAGNTSYGIRADTIDNVMIGGLTAAEGNVIAGNSRGLNLGYGSHDNAVLNNIIGLDATGTVDLADSGNGIEISDSFDNQIGAPGDGNVIAGMSQQGIRISGADSYGNVIQGNWIGTNQALASTLGNDFSGIFVMDSSNNKIGGTGAGEGNVIAHNYQFGVWVERGEGNEISGNSIFGNYFGIDIDAQGFFPNDGGDGDDGGNRAQNYPLIASAVVDPQTGFTEVEGLLINEPNTEYRVELFSSPGCGNAGFGEGKTFRGSTQVTTDGGGQAALATSIPQPISDDYLTATVTDPFGNTSEFSPCSEVDLGENPGRFQFDRTAYVGYEGIIPATRVIVTRSHGLSGTATVELTTADGSAHSGEDYTDSDQTLSFAPWEVVKHVEVPILLELAPEPDYEKVLLALSSPSAGASLGTPATSEIQIIDYTDDYPGLTVSDAFVDEGDGGEVVLTFTIQLTPTDHQVEVAYQTEPGSAIDGVDYEFATAEIVFAVSASTQTIQVQVPILGDTDVEADEIVWLRILGVQGGGNWVGYDAYGRGEIRNDDFSTPPPGNTIFADGFEIGTSALWSSWAP